ncbi:hypothetical protein EC960932_2330, partial [Escherichia coli 96.0932]
TVSFSRKIIIIIFNKE